MERIAQIIEKDKALPKKQRHTAKRICDRLGEMGWGRVHPGEGSVRKFLRVKQEVFMPLVHRVGEAQANFGYALAKVAHAEDRTTLTAVMWSESYFLCGTLCGNRIQN